MWQNHEILHRIILVLRIFTINKSPKVHCYGTRNTFYHDAQSVKNKISRIDMPQISFHRKYNPNYFCNKTLKPFNEYVH